MPMPSDALRRAEARGRAEGKAEGETVRLLRLIQRKVGKGKGLSEIADELEDAEEVIRPFYEAVQKYGVECPADEIYANMVENEM